MNNSLETLLYGMQFRRLMEKELKPIERQYGLQKIDINILLFLDRSGDRNTSKDIMQLNMFTRGHISQSLSRLQKKGYIKMEQDPKDRRCTHNYLTPEAGAITETLRNIFNRIHSIIMEGVTEKEQDVMEDVARKVNRNIMKVL